MSSQLAKRALKKLDNTLKRRMQVATAFVNTEARRRCPVDTGNLRGSLTSKVYEPDTFTMVGEVSTNVEYAGYVEFGAKLQGAQPYLRPALRENITQIKKFLRGL